jgi:integrase
LSNPCLRLKLPPVQARLRVATLDEIAALIKEADASDPEIGDAIVLALFTGQRQGDVLALEERAVEDGKIRFIQSKTGARVRVKALPPLIERLTSARMRRMTQQMRLQAERSNRQVSSTIVVDSRTSETFSPFAFRHRFGALRARAAKETESLADLLFLDLRDTAVTWLANAGCTVPEIAAISGHSLQSVHNILRHYLESNEEQADNAMDKLESWLTAKKWGK